MKYDNVSHGSPHKISSEIFWETKRPFVDKYRARFRNFEGPAPADPCELTEDFRANPAAVMEVVRNDRALVDYLVDRLVQLGHSVPDSLASYRLGKQGNPFCNYHLCGFRGYPSEQFANLGRGKPIVRHWARHLILKLLGERTSTRLHE